jgi:hypothetical protein
MASTEAIFYLSKYSRIHTMTTNEHQPNNEYRGYVAEYAAAFGAPAVSQAVEVDWNVRDVDPHAGVVRTVENGDMSARDFFTDAMNRAYNGEHTK